MSSNTSEAATTAIDQEAQDNQTTTTEQQAQADTTATTEQSPEINTPSPAGEEATQGQTATTAQQPENNLVAANDDLSGTATGPGGSSGGISGATASEPKPDVSDQDYQELLPKLLNHFHNNREELARALGLHRSTVDRWLNGKSRPNNSTVLRMRRLAQERRIE
jgi:DNA-binding NtrC family response regulator